MGEQIPRELVAIFDRFDRRLHALETAPRAPFTSVRGGAIHWTPVNGSDQPYILIGAEGVGDDDIAIWVIDDTNPNAQVYIGTVDGKHRLEVRNDDNTNTVMQVVEGQMVHPRLAATWQIDTNVNIDAQGRPTVAVNTYTTLWRAWLYCSTREVFSHVVVYPGLGPTADVRLMARSLTSVVPAVQIHQTLGIVSTTTISGPWTIPESILDPAASPIGQILELTIQLKRPAGAAPVAVAPYPVVGWV